MEAPPPPPPPDPSPTDLLPHPTSFPISNPLVPSSDLVRSDPDRAAPIPAAVPATSDHLLLHQHPQQRSSSPSRSISKNPPFQPSSCSVLPPTDLQLSADSRPSQLQAAALSAPASDPEPATSVHLLHRQPPPLQRSSSSRRSSSKRPASAHFPPRSEISLQPSSSSVPTPPDLQVSAAFSELQAAAQSSAPAPAAAAVSSEAGPAAGPSSSAASLVAPQQQPPHLGTAPLSAQLPVAGSQLSFADAAVQQPVQQPVQQAAVHPHPLHNSSAAPLPTSALLAPLRSSAPQQQTYAQVARHSRGTGFVRSHASDVESFARLPRTGVNIICGTKEGMPSFSFVNSELPMVEELYANALVMKFHGGRPSLEASHKEIHSWGIEHPFSIGPLSSRAFLLRFQDNVDLLKVLTRPSSTLITFSYKVYRWHNLCHMKEDSCFAPVWISLPRLPLQCFVPEFLESVANRIGRFLCFDKATSTLARPSAARICVELDLRSTPPPFIWVGLFEGFKQQIIYERMPKYCNLCHVIGHMAEVCHKATPAAASISDVEHRVPSLRGRPLAARQHTPQQASSTQRVRSSTSAPPPHPLTSSIQQPAAAPSTVDAQFQHHPSASLLQRAPAAAMPASSPPPQQSAPTLPSATIPPAESERIQSSSAMVQRVPSAAGTSDAHFSAQQTVSLQQTEPAAAGPSSSSHPPVAMAPISGKMGPSVVQPPTPLYPLSSPTPKHQKRQQNRKSVSFAQPPTQQQSNIQANSDYWEAANRQVAIIEQARLTSSSASSSSHLAGIHSLASANPILSIQTPLVQVAPSSVESDSGSSIAADTPPSSPNNSNQDAHNTSDAFQSNTYVSEGEDPAETSLLSGHNSDGQLCNRPLRSNRNKRHPDQPLKVQLRVRKGPTSTSLC